MIDYRVGGERFRTSDQGRTTWHSFSFGSHYDPADVGFAGLVAHNEELLPPGTGYADHPHADLEIVTWVVSGALRHTSSVGSGVIGPGQVQRLSAGSGVVHSEVAESDTVDTDGGETRFLQTWVRPDDSGLEPSYLASDVETGSGWTCVADGDGRGVVPLGARGTALHSASLSLGERLELPDAYRLHVHVTAGSLLLGERSMKPGDTARLLDEGGRTLTAEADTQVVVWAFARH